MLIRDAVAEDLPVILAIYNDAVLTTTAVWTEATVDFDERRQWWAARRAMGYPVLVAEEGGVVAGFASFGDFRGWPGYRHTVEHSVYVDRGARRRGAGAALVRALGERAATLGKHAMIAGIEAGNVASLRLHERLGFREVGRLPEVGAKFGRWLDLALLHRALDGRAAPPPTAS